MNRTIHVSDIKKIVNPIVKYCTFDENNIENLYKVAILSYLVAKGYTPSMAIKIYKESEKKRQI